MRSPGVRPTPTPATGLYRRMSAPVPRRATRDRRRRPARFHRRRRPVDLSWLHAFWGARGAVESDWCARSRNSRCSRG
jgi:hypothetical protein